MKEIIRTDKAPAPVGPYSQGVRAGDFIFLSGQISLDPATMAVAGKTAPEQAKRILENIKGVLESQGAGFGDVVKTTVFIKDMNDFGAVNEAYASYFNGSAPARSCVEVSRLPKDMLVEIEAIAYVGK